ncbi:DUF551 domain-containing protein [Blautia faecis]|uniref:DUF551 domain-containing protein n=1 Tax=Blautia faecis TaxID=871665 RepID=UPI001C00FD03|nr:DUF551 domain-containing protein [Blautia faecis]
MKEYKNKINELDAHKKEIVKMVKAGCTQKEITEKFGRFGFSEPSEVSKMVSRIKERLLQYKQELQKQTMYKEGLPGSSLDIVNSLLDALEQDEKENGWIPIDERLPDPDKHILVSFFNFSLPMIGRYTVDDDDGGTFRVGDEDESFVEHDLYVNAWMSLPEPYEKD